MRNENIPAGFWVFLGGGAGACARWILTFLLPFSSMAVTCGINILGAFCLGFLLAFLAESGSDEGSRKIVRLALGTGFMGGFTTYSAFAVQSATSMDDATPFFLYLATTLIFGVLACWLGHTTGSKTARHAGRKPS